jgi:hypothetical protein
MQYSIKIKAKNFEKKSQGNSLKEMLAIGEKIIQEM